MFAIGVVAEIPPDRRRYMEIGVRTSGINSRSIYWR